MNFARESVPSNRAEDFVALFARTFADSEGEAEGCLIGALVRDLLNTTPEADLWVFSAREDGALAGCIMFTPLRFDEDTRRVYLLSPVAVATGRQGQGIGQALLRHGLDALRADGADVAVTYGDPGYYGRVGFGPVAAEDVRPPLPLSQPEGWLAQSLTDRPLTPLKGPSRCVAALDDPGYW